MGGIYMRLAIISDTHLGDSMSVMAFKDPTSNEIQVGCKYNEFKEKVKGKFDGKKLDYLVLLGDILDFSVSSYSDTYAIGKFFFQKLKDDDIAEEIIYVPGNHDFDMWNTVEYQVNVTNPVLNGKAPRPFRMSVPGIIDDRKEAPKEGFSLFKVRENKENNKPKYAGLFLDHITNPPTAFNFVFPNLYLLTENETVLITHGQYLEAFWSILGKWGLKIIDGDLDIKNLSLLDLNEMVAIDFPLCQLSCSGIGQAGPLTTVIQKLEHEIKEHNVTRIETYFFRLQDTLKEIGYFKSIFGFVKKLVFKLVRNEALKKLSNLENTRYNTEFIEEPAVRERFKDFFNSTVYEIGEVKEKYCTDFPLPLRMIFGHTHQPIPWDSPKAPSIELPQLPKGTVFKMYNSGGWLNRIDKNLQPEFCGAEIFFYDTDEGFSSVNVGYDPENILARK
jgi:hypothetical protein